MPFAELPDDKAGQRQDDHNERADQDVRVEPVEIIALIEDRLHPQQNR